jgi:hypothetical protein
MLFGASASQAADQKDVEKSIVLIGTTWSGFVEYPAEGGGTDFAEVSAQSFCTGWFASDEGHIVTAGHCVDPVQGRELLIRKFLTEQDAMNLLQKALTNWKVDGGEGQNIKRKVETVQTSTLKDAIIDKPMVVTVLDLVPTEDGDVALLQAQGLSEKTPALAIADERPELRANVTAIGFPGSVQAVSDDVRPSFKTGTVSSYQVHNGVSGIEINAELGSGMSGGPTVNDNGEVVGVNSYKATANDEANFNFVTDTNNLQSFLKQNDVPINVVQPKASADPSSTAQAGAPLNTERSGSDSGGVPVWVWVVVGLVLLLAVAAFILRRQNALPAFAGGRGKTERVTTAPVPTTPVASTPVASALCPNGHENPPGVRFCGQCGSAVGEAPTI